MFDSNQPYEMICEEALFLMIPMLVNDPGVTDQESEAFKIHLLTCSVCVQEYEETKEIASLVRDYWGPISEETRKLLGQTEEALKLQNQTSPSRSGLMTMEDGWEDLKRRIPELSQLQKRRKRLQLFRRISIVAACLVIGVFIWMAFSIYSKPEISQESIPEQVVFSPKASIKIELLSDNSNAIIPVGTEIKTTSRELKALVLNGKHRMVMNFNTDLKVEPLVENSRIGCLVSLASGQIYTNVEYDGNPFVVETAHGKSVITGTTFDVRVTDTCTMLMVTEGTVRFESEKGTVEVAAGQISKILAQSAPTKPVSCNNIELTTWATGRDFNDKLAKTKSSSEAYGLDNLWFSTILSPIDFESINYEDWIEKNRDRFKREFPWIFQLKDALAREGIEVDYPELLTKSGDVWQFVCLDVLPARFSVINPNSLLKTASGYSFDKQWLLENIPAAKSALENFVSLKNSFTGPKAFDRWLGYLDERNGLEPPTPIYSYYASKYLAETRNLIWFAVRDGEYNLTDKERAEVLALLQQEITAACECQNEVLYPRDDTKSSCDRDQGHEVELISVIYECEKALVKYIPTMSSTSK